MESNSKNNVLLLISRVALSVIFIAGGFDKITAFAMNVEYAAAYGVPFPELAIAAAIVIELLGGLMLLVGYKTKWAALGIVLFLIPVTVIFHGDFGDPMQMTMFMKNLAIFGGLLALAVAGAGSFSVDKK